MSLQGLAEGGNSTLLLKRDKRMFRLMQTLLNILTDVIAPTPHQKDINDNRRSAQVSTIISQSALYCNSSHWVDFKVPASLQPDRFPAHMHAWQRYGCLGGTGDNWALIAPTGSACPSQCHISG